MVLTVLAVIPTRPRGGILHVGVGFDSFLPDLRTRKRFILGRNDKQSIAGTIGSPCCTSLEQAFAPCSPESTRKNTPAALSP